MTSALRRQLAALAEPEYRNFQQALLPGVENYLGVRLPRLHRIAAALAKDGWQTEFAAPDETFEETLLRGMVIGRLRPELPELLSLVRGFLPCIDNWCTCDTFCAGLKAVPRYKDAFFALAAECAASGEEFTARFGAVLLLRWWAAPADLPAALDVYKTIRCPALYARMGRAWGYAEFAAVDFESTLAAMRAAGLDDDTWNLALQKMRESRRIPPEQKELCKQWKRNKR